ncbi:MAG: hypothetical protein H6Q30_318 [Bacteroidetes bacterium]|jgi:hypothetical protein|nr:hypothetical protein [Bacteroidota bacterium]
MKINYTFPRLSQTEREYLEMVLLEEMEMQSWFTVTYAKALGGEFFLMLQ